MQVTPLFSTPVLETIIDNIEPTVLEYVRQLPFELTSNKCCEFSVSKRLNTDPFFFNLYDKVRKVADVYARELLGFDLTSPDYFIDIKTSWSIKMKPGDFAYAHYHSHSIFTGVLYLNVDRNESNKLNFIRPTDNNPTIEIPINNWNMHNCNSYFITPQSNKLVLFPSNIKHSADINESNETLYSLIFDFFPKGVLSKNTPGELILN